MNEHLEIQLDDLPESVREVANLIGIDALMEIIAHYGGERVYIPKKQELTRKSIEQQAKELLKTMSAADAAKKLKVSRQTIYRIIHKQKKL
jgi:Mor family transcriptional regulator